MLQDGQSWDWRLGLAGFLVIGSAIVLSGNCALAQITPDGTLGAEGSTVTPNVSIDSLPGDRIDGGATRGTNLFHSFLDFNVGNGQRVYFANPVGIENILSRVTGNNLSNILGTLGVDGGANLFLLNPNGIIFGENAKLDIAGSFVASTANSVVFNNGYKFSAKNPETPPLLTVNVPLGVQYGTNQLSTTIANSGNLAVGQNLTLSTGNLDLQGQLQAGKDLTLQAQDTVKMRDSSTSPFIAASGGNLLVQGNQGVDIFALNHLDSGLFSGGSMVLRSANTVGGDAHYWSGGSFRIEKLDGSLGDLYSPNDPIIRSLGDVNFNTYRGTSLHILAGGSVNIGTVIITGSEVGTVGSDFIAENVQLSDGTEIAINGSVRPTLDIRAGMETNQVAMPGFTGFNFPTDRFFFVIPNLTNSPTKADITVGDVWINAPNGSVFLTNQYKPNTSLSGDITVTGAGLYGNGIDTYSSGGNGGDIILDSRDSIILTNSIIDSSSETANAGSILLNAKDTILLTSNFVISQTSGEGKGGDVTINTGQLLLKDGSQILVGTLGTGLGGNLIVNASESVQLIGVSPIHPLAGSTLSAGTDGTGKAGNITVTTPTLHIRDGGRISVSTEGAGDAGSLTVNASESVEVIGLSPQRLISSALFAQANRGATGNAGDLTINTKHLLVRDGAQVAVSNLGTEGAGGNLTVNASESVEVIGIGISANGGEVISGLFARTEGAGDAKDLTINTRQLIVRDGAAISASTRGEGDGGDLIVNASESIQLIGESSGFRTQANRGATGNAGDLTITTRQFLVQDGAQVTVSNPQGQAGNLSITANSLTLNRGTLSAETAKSDAAEGGANITLNGLDFLRMDNESLISASALGNANGGNVTIDSTLIVATPPTGPEGSDIIANAFQGNGGRVNVTTEGLFGIQFRPQRTPKNDITVSSIFGLSGEYTLNSPGVDPSRGLTQLPTNVVDPTKLIDRHCTPNQSSDRRSSFTFNISRVRYTSLTQRLLKTNY